MPFVHFIFIPKRKGRREKKLLTPYRCNEEKKLRENPTTTFVSSRTAKAPVLTAIMTLLSI